MFGFRSTIFLKTFFLLALIWGSTNQLCAQEQLNVLKKRKEQNSKDIAYTNSLLESTLKNKKISLSNLLILNQKIKSREDLIHSIESEISLMDSRITGMEMDVRKLESEVKKLKNHYAKSIYYAYKHRNSYEKLMFLFSANDFNQAYRRLKYLQQYSEFSRQQARGIVSTKDSINQKVVQLKSVREEKKDLLGQQTKENLQLSHEKAQQTKMVSQLQKKEKKLQEDLRKQQRYAKKLEGEIQRIIEREAQLAAKKKKGSGKFSLTPEEKLLSDNFGKNKGRLPWPTRTGFISETFGEHPHPVLKHVKVRNDGINITTDANADCRAVFQGVVTHVLPMPGLNTVVIIRHGEFFSVYSNLTDVTIKKGDHVAAKQKIGVVYTDASEGETVLKFQLWQGSNKLNPSQWLYRN